MALSKEHPKCKECEHRDDCDEKRMVACAVYNEMAAPVTSELTMPLAQDVMVKHDYRDIKIGENTTVTVDLEEMKKRLTESIYKQLGCPGF